MLTQQLQSENGGSTRSSSASPTPPVSVSQDESGSASTSLASSVNSKECLDENHHSDDSGISASSSPVNGSSANSKTEKQYIRPNGYSMIPSPPPQKLITRTVSTPQIFTPNRRITFGSSQKGLMQRFIASRGKLPLAQTNTPPAINTAVGPTSAPLEFIKTPTFNTPETLIPAVIERDADGKPIRRGYVPVEEKIQKELKDLKSRETELKRIRKLHRRQSTPDLLDTIDDENISESEDDSDVEHCFGPGKLRSSKSISELCDSVNINNNYSLSERTTPSPDFDSKAPPPSRGMRPALSLAQLCDLDPEEAPSSHQLIAKWESLIQKNA